MGQDDRKGQGSTRGQSPPPSAPDTPDTRDIKAPPPPEAPGAPPGEPEAKPEPPGADDRSADARTGNERPGESESERLRREIEEGRKALAAKEAELDRVEAQRQADEAAAKQVSDYAAEVPALKASERELRQYQTAATSFLNEVLPGPARAAIAEVHKEPEREIADLRASVEREEREADQARAALAEARQAATEAKDRTEALKNPAASVRDRIKRADTVRGEAMKASDAGRYALAYWLVMPGGRLERAIAAEPEIIPPEDLGAAIKAAASDQKEADARVASLTDQVARLDAAVQADRKRLADLQRGLDAKLLGELAKLNPQTAAAA